MNKRPLDNARPPEPIYSVELLPEVREKIEEYARDQKIPVPVAIAEACRSFTGLGE